MHEPAADLVVPLPSSGRIHTVQRRVRFGDVSPGGRARFDALADYVQDVAGDDTADSGLVDEDAWVVRRSVFEVHHHAEFRELLSLQTFCSGLGGRWAERRVVMRGDGGAHVESTSLWVRIDAHTGRPRPLTDAFVELYAPSAAGRRVSAKLQHDTHVPAGAASEPWPLRFTDFDLLGHVNNAASWAVVEQQLAALPELRPPYRAELEFRDPIERGASVTVAHAVAEGELRVWAFDDATSTNHLTAKVVARAPQV